MPTPPPPLLLAVDPGARGCGVALFRDGALVRAEYLAFRHSKATDMPEGAAAWWGMANLVDRWALAHQGWLPSGVVLVEDMRVYAGAAGKANPADLLHLQAVSGAVVALFAGVGWQPESVKAAEWNGSVPREIRMARTRAWLEERGEADRLISPAVEPRLVHNAISAAGIGIWRICGHK